MWFDELLSLKVELVPAAFADISRDVYLLFVTLKANDIDVTAFTAPFTPSVAEMVSVKVPALASTVLGVIVNTLSVCETVAIEPKPDVA